MEPQPSSPPAPHGVPNGGTRPRATSRFSLGPYGLGELLLRIAEGGLTGRLVFGGHAMERTLYCVAGYPVCCRSSLFSERLGALGVRHGFFHRDDVRSALALSSQHGRELGRALLELECVDGVGLFSLLAQQLMGQLASAAGPSEGRATFEPDVHAGDRLVVLRTHAMTATTAAVRALTLEERARALRELHDHSVDSGPLPGPASEWLRDLGYVGEPDGLVAGNPTVAAVRARLVARMRPHTRRVFDPATLPRPDAPSGPVPGIPAPELAELLTLALLASRAIALEPVPPGAGERNPGTAPLRSPGAVLAGAIKAASWRPPMTIAAPEAASGPTRARTPSALHRAHRDYLTGQRPEEIATRLNAWGAAGEVDREDEALNPVLTLYLAMKAEPTAEAILGVDEADDDATVATAYLSYRALLHRLEERSTTALSRYKAAELHATIDAAYQALVPGTPLPDLDETDLDALPRAAIRSTMPRPLGRPSEVPQPPSQPAPDDDDPLAIDVEFPEDPPAPSHARPPAVQVAADPASSVHSTPMTSAPQPAQPTTEARGHGHPDDSGKANSRSASMLDLPWPASETTPTEFFESVAAFEAARASSTGQVASPLALAEAHGARPDATEVRATARSGPDRHRAPSPSERADGTLTRRRLETPHGGSSKPEESLSELTTRVETLLVQGHWEAVLEALEPRRQRGRLSPALRMALAIAQREEAREEQAAGHNRASAVNRVLVGLVTLLAVAAAGWFARGMLGL